MIMTEREIKREQRKLDVLVSFEDGETLYTNQVAKKVGVVWPVADRLLIELVEEGRLEGDKRFGYSLPKHDTLLDKIRRLFHV